MRHFYVHVPFCRRRCVYCDFSIAVRRIVPADDFVDAILWEFEHRRATEGWTPESPQTLYFGGGTPSLLPPPRLARLVRGLLPAAGSPQSSAVEVTLEANPDDVTAQAADAWIAAGVNRVSLGVQSFDAGTLEWMHRTHQVGASRRAVHALRRAGLPSLSLDLIFALPDGLRPDLQIELERALELEPDHLAVYGLTIEPRTPLARWADRGVVRAAPDARYQDEFLLAHETLTAAGFEHYEVSNYARPGRRSRHNSAYWTGRPYTGLGPSAHSYRGPVRRWNLRPWAAYLRAVRERRDPIEDREVLARDQQALEALYLGLRTLEGAWEDLVAPSAAGQLQAAEEQGWLVRAGGRVRPTPTGWLRLESLVTDLTTSHGGG